MLDDSTMKNECVRMYFDREMESVVKRRINGKRNVKKKIKRDRKKVTKNNERKKRLHEIYCSYKILETVDCNYLESCCDDF